MLNAIWYACLALLIVIGYLFFVLILWCTALLGFVLHNVLDKVHLYKQADAVLDWIEKRLIPYFDNFSQKLKTKYGEGTGE